MKQNVTWTLSFGVILGLAGFQTARAELVYEPEISPNAPAQLRAEDREVTREALQSAEKARVTVQSLPVQRVNLVPVQTQAVVPVQPVTQITAPVTVQAPVAEVPQPEVQSLSQTELKRRERTRIELKNEDILQERLEELRLRDEQRRTQALLGDSSATAQIGQEQVIAPIPGLAQPQSQVVVSPVTEHPGQAAPELVAPVPSAAQVQQYSAGKPVYGAPVVVAPANGVAHDQILLSQSQAVSYGTAEESGKTAFSITPRAGFSGMNVNSGFTVSGHFALGVTGAVLVSDNLGFEVGYSYSEYGIGYGSNIVNLYGAGTQFDAYTLKQNVIDANLKLYFLGPDSKLRPYLSGGFGYAIGYLNYPSNILSYYQGVGYQNLSQDYKTNAYLGSVGAGMDIKVNKSVSIGAQFRYYTVLSVNENNNLYYGAYGPGAALGALSSYGGAVDPTGKAPAGSALAQSSFYSITGGVSFSF